MALRSPRHPKVALLRDLSHDARARRDRGLFVVDGPVLVAEALDAGVEILDVFWVDGRVPSTLIDRVVRTGAGRHEVAGDTLTRATDPATPQGVAAIARSATLPTADPTALPDGPVVALDGVAEPGNVGTILRSAEAAGATAVLVGSGSADPTAPKVVRASAGSRFRVPVAVGDLGDLLGALPEAVTVLGVAPGRGAVLDTVDLTHPVALVLGSEAHGISAGVGDAVGGWVQIPTVGVESLNVAMAATVALFECARQRRNGFAQVGPARQGSLR